MATIHRRQVTGLNLQTIQSSFHTNNYSSKIHFNILLPPVTVAARSKATARLLRSWVRIPPGAWMSVCCECCVLLGRGLCDKLTTRPEESYRLWCVPVCGLETSSMGSQTSIVIELKKIGDISLDVSVACH